MQLISMLPSHTQAPAKTDQRAETMRRIEQSTDIPRLYAKLLSCHLDGGSDDVRHYAFAEVVPCADTRDLNAAMS